ncbi:hypothetical protein [Klebsiella quasivariicola]|uniref:Uncharacterized protein n=1 Tax=Klebsiella quasivariicola TaxID=2026240 RepID=A0A8B4TQI1_9ENTR|nr:hypothetical protein [Klebsiella quasivariicola]SXD86816.1 Uncharacterised protein [Klebsiella quasivariicola]
MTKKYDIKVGDRFQNRKGSWYEVVKYNNCEDVMIKFDAGDYSFVQAINIRTGSVKSAYDKSVHGIGCVGEGVFSPTVNGKLTKLYNAWYNMMRRCYNADVQERQPTYKGCTVHPWWHNFQHFAADAHYLDGFEDWYKNDIPHAWALDKDIILPGNKEYGPNACKFVHIEENSKHKGDWYE